MDIAAAAQRHTEQTQRSAELDRREREFGGLIPGDREREDIARSVAGWTDTYRASISKREVKEACADDWRDPREITTGRLMFDVARAVRRWCGKWSKDEQSEIANAAALLLLQWPSNGTNPALDLGGIRAERLAIAEISRSAPSTALGVLAWVDRAERLAAIGTLPLRRDWLSAESDYKLPSRLAIRALRAAVKQAADALSAPSADIEISTDPIDIAALIESESAERGDATRLPDIAAPELIARYLDIGLDAARAVVAQAWPSASHTDLAASWGMSPQTLSVALSRGRIALRERYPDPATLLADLATVASAYRVDAERGAIMALIDYRDELISADVARGAVAEYRESSAALSDASRAILSAARNAIKRSGGTYGSERAERIALCVPRLVSAEQRAAKRATRKRSAGNVHACAASAQHSAPSALVTSALVSLAKQREQLARELDSACPDGDRVRSLRAEIKATLSAARA
jgi:hypothetical protein